MKEWEVNEKLKNTTTKSNNFEMNILYLYCAAYISLNYAKTVLLTITI
jgi:hypothetical protein